MGIPAPWPLVETAGPCARYYPTNVQLQVGRGVLEEEGAGRGRLLVVAEGGLGLLMKPETTPPESTRVDSSLASSNFTGALWAWLAATGPALHVALLRTVAAGATTCASWEPVKPLPGSKPEVAACRSASECSKGSW